MKSPCVLLALACALAAQALPAAKYPPGVRWREIGHDAITVIFPAGRSAEAAAALASARALNLGLASTWGFRPRGRTRIVLGDFTDQANGFATFFPYNLVGVDLAEPPPDSEIASSREWLDLALAHELTHIQTLNAGSGPFRLARRLFGANPVFFPATQLPPWAVEGLAIEGESRLSGAGRLNRAPYRLMLAAARRDGAFPAWRSLAGMPAAWPGGSAKYLFGAGFMEHLADKHGTVGLRRYVERFSSRVLTLGASRDFKKLFAKPLGGLWNEYREGQKPQRRTKLEPLTKDGFANRYPCSLAGDATALYHRDYRGRGEVRLVDRAGGERVLFKKDAVGSLAAGPRGRLLLSASELHRSFRDFSDLYEYEPGKGTLKRLSKGKRLSCPAWDPSRPGDRQRIYCVERRNNRSRLALFDPQKGEARSISMAFAGLAQAAVSRDGTRIAAAAKPVGGPWGIAVFQASGGLEQFLSLAGSDLSQPRWQADGKLLFIVTGRETSFLAAWSDEASGAWRLDEPRLAGTRQFDISRDGREILFVHYTGRGEEIARVPAEWIPQSPLDISVAAGIPDAKTAAAIGTAPAARPYRFWRDLLPRWWSPALRAGGDEAQAGAATGGQDALGIHSWRLEGYYGLDSRRGNFLFRYAFDGLFPTLSLLLGDSGEYDRDWDGSVRTRELTLAAQWPLRLRKRSQFRAYTGLHLEKRTRIFGGREDVAGDMRNGFRLGIGFDSTREYYDSVSRSDGIALAVQGTIQPAGMGNELASSALQADLRVFLPLFRPGVLALRLAAAKNWEPGSRYYDMGGFAAESGLGSSHPFRLLRAFATNEFHGDEGWQLNAEYRLPLLRINKGIFPSLALDRVWLRPFLDLGRLAYRYHSYRAVMPVMVAVGGEVMLRLAAGGAASADFAIGFARGSGPFRQDMIYFGAGGSF